MTSQQRAGLLNLFAKIRDDSANNVFRQVINIFKVKPARICAEIHPQYGEWYESCRNDFTRSQTTEACIPLTMDGLASSDHASFTTPDPMGNLQLTFATQAETERPSTLTSMTIRD